MTERHGTCAVCGRPIHEYPAGIQHVNSAYDTPEHEPVPVWEAAS